MRKISLFVLACFVSILSLMGQDSTASEKYNKKKLAVEEVNIISSIYSQDGNNSGVTAGIGTEKLMDYSNQVEIKILGLNKKGNKHQLGVNMGVDYYTSASSDNIEHYVFATTSPSYSDKRFYPSVNYKFENATSGNTFGGGLYYSQEFDYRSVGMSLSSSKYFNQKNTEISAKGNIYLDEVTVIRPYELRESADKNKYNTAGRNSLSLSTALNQVLSKRMQMSLLVDLVYQSGFLSTPFNRVKLVGSAADSLEILPSTRFKLPIGTRFNYYINDKSALRTYYRVYWDNWGILSNTLEAELPTKITQAITLSPYFRVYQQTAAKYFGAYNTLAMGSQYRTSDYDLSEFISIMPGLSARIQPENGIIKSWFHSIDLKYSYYHRSNNLNAHNVTVMLKFK